jgi:pyrophosphatase PpaX
VTKQAVLFDLDGTLIDTKELILSSFRYATREVLGKQVSDEAVLPLIGIPLIYQMRAVSAEHADELMVVYREHNARVHDELVRYFEGMCEALEALTASGKRLAVVTSKRREPALRGLECFDLARYFEFLIGSDDTTKHKPEPEPLLFAVEKLGLEVDDCIYVGDSPFDMQAARAAGVVALAALWGIFPQEALLGAGAQYEAAAPRDLPAVVSGI